MDTQQPTTYTPQTWRRRALLWLVLCAAVIAGLTASLHEHVLPWRVVWTSPSSVVEGDGRYIRRSGHFSTEDLEPNGRRLAVGRPHGKLEILDLDERESLMVFNDVAFSKEEDVPNPVLWVGDGTFCAWRMRSGWRLVDTAGREYALPETIDDLFRATACRVCPHWAVYDRDRRRIVVVNKNRITREWNTALYSSNMIRFQFSPDGRLLLLAGSHDIMVLDVESGETRWHHDDLYRSYSCSRQAASAISSSRAAVPTLMDELEMSSTCPYYRDCQFSPDGSSIIVLHVFPSAPRENNDDGPDEAFTVQLYKAHTGEVIESEPLPFPGQGLFRSSSKPTLWSIFAGYRLHYPSPSGVACSHQKADTLRCVALDQHSLQPKEQRQKAWERSGVSKAEFLRPQEAVVYGAWNDIWVVDLATTTEPLRLDAKAQTRGLFTPDSDHIAVVTDSGWVRLWERTGGSRSWGAFSLPQTWALLAVCLALPLGLTIIAGRDTVLRIGHPLPAALWAALVMVALGTGGAIFDELAGLAVAHALDPHFVSTASSLSIGSCLGIVLGLSYALGVARLRRGWYILLLVLSSMGMVLSFVVILWLGWVAGSREVASPVLWDSYLGLRYPVHLTLAFALPIGALAWIATHMILLTRPQVRRLFPAEPDGGPAEAGREPLTRMDHYTVRP